MANELAQTIKETTAGNSQWDSKKIAGAVVGGIIMLGLMAALGYVIWHYILPFLLGVIAMAILIPIGCVVVALAFWFLTSKNTWLAFQILGEGLAENLLGWIIELDRFKVLQLKIDEMAGNREKLRLSGVDLRKQQDKLGKTISAKDNEMRQSQAQVKALQTRLQASPNDELAQDNLEVVTNNFTNAKSVIDSLQPQLNNINELVKFTDKAYRKTGIMLTNAQNTLNSKKQIYESTTSSSNAMSRAMKAFNGDPNMTKAADQALASLNDEMSAMMGNIQSSLQITSQIMDQKDLEDAGKVALAAQMAASFDDNKFNYSDSLENKSDIPQISAGNKYITATPVNS